MDEKADVICDKAGQPKLRLLENGRLVDFGGRSIGFIDSGSAYNYKGNHCGWYKGGILRDRNGDCVGFGEEVMDTGRPLLPPKSPEPLEAPTEIEPPRPITEPPSTPLIESLDWSQYTPVSLFRI
jgi:hypothetical protein